MSFPRQQARTRRFRAPGVPPRDFLVSPRRQPRAVSAHAKRHRCLDMPLGRSTSRAAPNGLLADPAALLHGRRRRGAGRGADASRAGARSLRRHRSVLDQPRGHASGLRRRRKDLRRGPDHREHHGGVADEQPGDRSTQSTRQGPSGRIRRSRSPAGRTRARQRVAPGAQQPECATTSRTGLAEFVAAEEMGRQSGYWWPPNGNAAGRQSRRRRARSALVYRRSRQSGSPAGYAVAYPASGNRQRRCDPAAGAPRRRASGGGCMGSSRLRVRDDRRVVGARLAHRCAEPRSTNDAHPRGGHVVRRDLRPPRGHR